jgi:hypothetical protein
VPRTTFKHTIDIRMALHGLAELCASVDAPKRAAMLGALEPLVGAVLKLADEVDSLRHELYLVRSERR